MTPMRTDQDNTIEREYGVICRKLKSNFEYYETRAKEPNFMREANVISDKIVYIKMRRRSLKMKYAEHPQVHDIIDLFSYAAFQECDFSEEVEFIERLLVDMHKGKRGVLNKKYLLKLHSRIIQIITDKEEVIRKKKHIEGILGTFQSENGNHKNK